MVPTELGRGQISPRGHLNATPRSHALPMSIELILLIVAMSTLWIGAIRLWVWILGPTRINRGEAATSDFPLVTSSSDPLPDWLGDRLDDPVQATSGLHLALRFTTRSELSW